VSLALKFQRLSDMLLLKFDERTSDIDAIQLEQIHVILNPSTREDEPGTPIITNLIGVVSKFDREYTNANSNTNNNTNTIEAGDQLLKITSAVEPLMGDKISFDGLKYSIVSISPSRYTNKTILYTVHLRK